MNDDTEKIEILDDDISSNNINNMVNNEQPNNNLSQNITPENGSTNLGVSEVTPTQPINNEFTNTEKKLEDVKYDPIEPNKEEIKIEEPSEDKSKSGLGFVIVIFILLAAFIVALPYISKFLS